MFKNFRPFAYAERDPNAERPEFVPCGPSEPLSVGFVNHGNGEAVVHGVELVTIERKTVPSDLVKRRAEQAADQIEQETGRRPRGKRLREIKDEVASELLAKAFPKRKTVPVLWLDDLVVIGSTAASDVDVITSLYMQEMQPYVATAEPLGATLLAWARDPERLDPSLTLGRGLALVTPDDGRATFKDVHVGDPQVVEALRAAGTCVSLALSTERDTSFTLTDDHAFKGVRIVGEDQGGDHADAASATCFLWREELRMLLATVREALHAA